MIELIEPNQTSRDADLIRFAYWVPNVSGGLVISTIEQRTGWDFEYNIKLAQTAERSGFDYALSQIRFTAGYGADNQHEPVIFSTALLQATERLNLIVAVLPGPWHPAVLAKQIATLDHLSQGRVSVNIVSGWFSGEFRSIGQPWLDHDERYLRSAEFIQAIKGIWTEEAFTFHGRYYYFDNYTLKPKPIQKPHPTIFQGGSSRAARDNASKLSDVYFTNGNTLEGLKEQIDDIQAKARANGHRVRIGVNAFIIARDSEAEAREVLAEIIDKANPAAVKGFADEIINAGLSSPERQGNWAKSTFEDLVQYNDGFRTDLIGTPEQIAQRIIELKKIGVDIVLAGFLHFQEEIEYFGKRILPLLRDLETQNQDAKAALAIA
ncbi:MAG: dimethylsulfone monooxygenase SfnG [Cyanobacteriota bacterium]|jgi:FMNH2-dependent dimethyl sulfone monooxygenase